MSRTCDLVASKSPITGNQVSHSNRKKKRRFLPNLQNISFFSDALKKSISLRVATNTIRTIEKHGSLDQFLLNTSGSKLTCCAKKLKKKVEQTQAA